MRKLPYVILLGTAVTGTMACVACGPSKDCRVTKTCPTVVETTSASGGASGTSTGVGGDSASVGTGGHGAGAGGGQSFVQTKQRIAAGDAHTCVVTFENELYCWGLNQTGQVGAGDDTNHSTPYKLSIGAHRVAAGGTSTCSEADGVLRCWGANHRGQLGIGNDTNQSLPVENTTLTSVSKISLGDEHGCAVAAGGVWCWGDNTVGQVGAGNVGGLQNTPTITNIMAANWLAGAGQTSCAVDDGNAVQCWGTIPAIGPSPSPYLYSSVASAAQVAVGDAFICALLLDGTMRCWGDGGLPMVGASPSNPGLTDIVSVSAGGQHICAVNGNGAVFCWGQNDYGQLGVGPSPAQASPQPVASLSNVLQVAAGDEHTCAILTDDSVRCWGRNHRGQLGRAGGDSDVPVVVSF